MLSPFLDPKLKSQLARYLLQCGLATLIILGIMMLLDLVLHAAVIATLGASVFIVFVMPNSRAAQYRPLLGGYVIGSVAGLGCSLLVSPVANVLASNKATLICAALAVGFAIFGMVITNTEHPPAAGMALSMVLSPCDIYTIVCALGAIGLLAASRWLLRHILIDLV